MAVGLLMQAFDPAVDMLNAIGDSPGPGWPVAVPGSVSGRVILGRHEDLDLGQRKGQEAQCLQQPAPRGQGIRRRVGHALVINMASKGGTRG